MKRLLIILTWVCISQTAVAQTDTLPIYQRFPTVPLFTVMTVPDSIKFTKADLKNKKPTIIMLFSPDCHHCQMAVKELIENISLFDKAQVLMVSSMDFVQVKQFYEEYKIANFPNITMGRDASYYLGTFYKIKNYPSVFVYDKKGKLVEAFEGTFQMKAVADALD